MNNALKKSETKLSLMRAFAGESQARNRYTFAAAAAKKQGFQVVEAVFSFTAGQEKEHAEVFWGHLAKLGSQTVDVEGTYPVDGTEDVLKLLRAAQHNEYEESDPIYPDFAQVAEEEGFSDIAQAFLNIAKIEKAHGDRFGYLADLIENEALYVSDTETKWMCLNCGHVYSGTEVPAKCPVCSHDRGYFLRMELVPYTAKDMFKKKKQTV